MLSLLLSCFFILFYRTTVKLQYLHYCNPQEVLSASFCWQQQIYKWFSLRIWEDVCCTYHIVTSMPCKKFIKMLLSNWRVTVTFQGRFFLRFGFWTLTPRSCAALFEYMQSVRVLENISFCSWFVSFSDTFKCFLTADVFAALAHASLWSHHLIVRYHLFGLFAIQFRLSNKFGASLCNILSLLP